MQTVIDQRDVIATQIIDSCNVRRYHRGNNFRIVIFSHLIDFDIVALRNTSYNLFQRCKTYSIECSFNTFNYKYLI